MSTRPRSPLFVATRANRPRLGLAEIDSLLAVDRSERERDLLLLHLADTDPNVRGNPVPVGVGRHHDNVVGALQSTLQVQCSGVTRYSRTQYHHSSHCDLLLGLFETLIGRLTAVTGIVDDEPARAFIRSRVGLTDVANDGLSRPSVIDRTV